MAGPWEKYGATPASQIAPIAPTVIGTPRAPDPFKVEDQNFQRAASQRAEQEFAYRRERDQVEDARAAAKADEKVSDPKLVEAERTAGFLATRIAGGMQDINAALASDPSAAKPGIGAKIAGIFGDEARNWANSPERQRVEAAQMDVLDAALTLGTGAAYTREQLEGYRASYFPLMTDDEATVADKQKRLARVLAAAKLKAGNAAPQIDQALASIGGAPVEARPQGAVEFDATEAPKGWRMTPEQTQQFSGYLKATGGNITPETVASAYSAIAGGATLSPQDAAEVAKYIQGGGDPSKIGVNYGNADESAAAEAKRLADAQGKAGVTDLVMQGATLGLSDEASGVGNAVANAVASPFTDSEFDPVGSYQAGRDAERMRLDEVRQRMGGAGTAIEIGSSLASGNVSNALAIAPNLMGRVGQGMRAGAATGAVAGFGSGEGINSLGSSAGGAALGAGLGAVLPVGAQVIGNRVGGLRRLTGRDPALSRRIVNEAIEADGQTPAAVGQVMDEAASRGSPMMLADTGDNARSLLASVGRQPGRSRTITRDAVQGRQDAQAERISAAVVRDLGPTANIREMGDELIDRARTQAAPLYDQAFSAPGASSVKMDDLANRPAFRRALNKAANIIAEEGEDGLALGIQFDEAGDAILTSVPSFKTIDYIKRGMDDVIETYRDKTTGKLSLDNIGRATNDTLRTLIARADRVNPAYKEARAAYAGPARMRDAMEKGAKALNKSPDDIMAIMKNMGDSEQESFRLGIRKSIVDLLGSRRDGGDKVALLVGTPKSRAALTRVFGGRAEFERFIATLRDEQAMGQTYRSVTGNSATAERQAFDAQTDDQGLLEAAAESAIRGGRNGSVLGGMIGDALEAIQNAGRFGAGQAGERTRESVAALLSETDPAVLRELMAAVREASRQQSALTARRSRGAARLGRDAGVISGVNVGNSVSTRQ